MSRRPWRSRWFLIPAATVGVLVVAAVLVYFLAIKQGNVSHPNVSFTVPKPPPTHTTPTPKPKPKPAPVKHHHKPAPKYRWLRYGYTLDRARDYTKAHPNLKPPFNRGWTLRGNGPIEFPPVIYGRTLYFMDDDAVVRAVSMKNGHVFWKHKIGTLSAASPAVDLRTKMIYVPTLSDTSTSPGNGQFAAISMRTGKVVWHRPLPSGSESSPLVVGNYVYFGDQAGTVYALNAKTGAEHWSYQAAGAVKGGLALSDGLLYFGDYASDAYAISLRTGHEVWDVGTGGLGESGTFYTTPAVAFGRVYMGNTNGFVYSFAAKTGELAWRTSLGAYVYSSAAVADTPRLGPTVYVGSYNGYFYALDARSGAVRWEHRDGHDDRISGSPTIVNNVVYYSDLDDHLTTGLNAATGTQVFTFNDGAFSPVIASPGAIFMSGHYTLYKLVPRPPKKQHKRHVTAGKHHRQRHVTARKHHHKRHPTAGKHRHKHR